MTMPNYLVVNPGELPSGSGEDEPTFFSEESFKMSPARTSSLLNAVFITLPEIIST